MFPQRISPQTPILRDSSTRKTFEKWRGMVDDVAQDLEERGVYQPKIKRLPELVAKIYTNELSGGKGLLLMGAPGTGKTFLFRAISRMFEIRMVTAKELERTVSEESSFREILRLNRANWSEVPFHWYDLIIDDIGTEEPLVVDYGRNYHTVEEAILFRYDAFVQNGWITHFTTNLTLEGLRDRYGERCWSRLNEMCFPLAITGEDRRKAVS